MAQPLARSRISHREAEREVDANYESFLNMLPRLMETNFGEWAVLRNRELVDTYPNLGEAYDSALDQHPDHRFSIEEIREQESLDLGSRFAVL